MNDCVYSQTVTITLLEFIRINNQIAKERKKLVKNGVIVDINKMLFLKPLSVGKNYTTLTTKNFVSKVLGVSLKDRNTIIKTI